MTWSSWYCDNATRWWWRPWYPRWAWKSRTRSVHRRRRRWRRRRVRRQRRWRPRTAYAAPDTMIEYVAPAGSCAAPAPASARCRVHRASTISVLGCTSARRVQCCTSARCRVHSVSISGTPCFIIEHAPTAAYAAPDTVIEYVAPAGTRAAPAPVSEYAPTAAYAAHEAGCDEDASPKSFCGPLETMHTDVAA